MEFDQTYTARSMDWNFPSPSVTPTTASFHNNGHLLQTPKTASFPSHFQDAFSTPQMSSYATPQHIQYPIMTPVLRSQSSEEAIRPNFLANMQPGNGQSMLSNANQPMYQNQRVMMQSPMQAGPALISSSPAYNSSFGSSQMQTPPPTRGASARKVHPNQIAFGTPTTIASNRYLTPQQQPVLRSNVMQPASAQFPLLPFTSNTYQFPNGGQASAPAQPPSQMFWSQPDSPAMYMSHQQQSQELLQRQQLQQQLQQQPQPQAQRQLDDPFAPAGQPNTTWMNGLSPNLQTVQFDTPAMVSFPTQEAHPLPAPTAFNSASTNASIQHQSNPAGVDPSLLFSSAMQPESRSNSASHLTLPEKPTTKRKDSGNSNNSQTETMVPSSSLKPVSTVGVRRSNTTANTRPKSTHFESGTPELSRSHSISQVPRTASPLKRVARTPLGSISELKPAKRASVILTIDENGRARTETFPKQESPTKSMRERYPGLYDSDSSDDESDVSETPSRSASASLSFVKRDERRSKAARLDPPVENLEGLDIPRSNSGTSVKGVAPSRAAIAAAAQLRRSGSLRKPSSSRNNAARRSFVGVSQAPFVDSHPIDISDQQLQTKPIDVRPTSPEQEKASIGNVRHGLLAVNQESTLDAHNRRWSMMSCEQHMTQSLMPSHQLNDMSTYHEAPSTYSMQTSQPQHAMQIRCLCGIPHDQGQKMVRCASCTQWLHAPCIGVNGPQTPTNYLCFLCMKPTMSR